MDLMEEQHKTRRVSPNEEYIAGDQNPDSSVVNYDQEAIEAMHKVFEVNLLRELILGHLVNSVDTSTKDIRSVRLVQKNWLRDVTKLLVKSRKPLYRVTLTKDNSLNVSNYVWTYGEKALDTFVTKVALSPERIDGGSNLSVVPSFRLSLPFEFFQFENHTSFSNFLTGGCTSGLVELSMLIPRNGGTMDFIFPTKNNLLSFPILKKITATFCDGTVTPQSGHGTELALVTMHGTNAYFISLLQSILFGTRELREFTILFSPRHYLVPTGFQYVRLPQSLTKLQLNCTLRSCHLEGLALNSLPYLKHLSLTFCHIPVNNGVLYRVLNQFRKTLQTLHFYGVSYSSIMIPRKPTFFCLPVMESLEVFYIHTIHVELEPEIHFLQRLLPKLNNLLLNIQTVGAYRKWASDSCCFPTVTQLTASLVNDRVQANCKEFDLSFHLEEMIATRMTFPNVTVLEINVTGKETLGLRYMFQEMRQLTSLQINAMNSFEFRDSSHWDALLTGVPVQMTEMLGANPYFWDYANVELKGGEILPSITNLTALSSLCLESHLPEEINVGMKMSLISEATFHLALLKMPALKNLRLTGRFMVSPQITKIWKSAQRSISYTR